MTSELPGWATPAERRLAMWLEDVRTAAVDWDLSRYRRAATRYLVDLGLSL